MTIGKYIQLHAEEQKEIQLLKDLSVHCTLGNPLWYQLQRMGKNKALYACPKEFKYFKYQGNSDLSVFRGLAPWISRESSRRGFRLEQRDETVRPTKRLSGTIQLRDYQLGIPERIAAENLGIIRLGTGFGKTIIALRVIELLQTRGLIIVPRTDILEQFSDETFKYFGFRPERLGGKTPIIVETIQTLQRQNIKSRLDPFCFGCIIVDECHLSVPSKSRAVILSFAPKYLYGMTATPRREDGQSKAIEFLFGNILVDADLERIEPVVEMIHNNNYIPIAEYHEIINLQIKDKSRNKLIVDILKKETNSGRKVLVLTKRVEHHRVLKELYDASTSPEQQNATYGVSGSDKGRKRRELYIALRQGDIEFTVLFGSFSLLSTGFDLPRLDTLIIAGDLKSSILTQQSAGRILRLFENKKSPKIIDIVDKNNPILYRQAKKREKFYRDNNWSITIQYGKTKKNRLSFSLGDNQCDSAWQPL